MAYANKDLKIDKEFENWIPPLTKEEFEQLQENCCNDGIREPICIWNDLIIDGHNRFKISKDNGWLDFDTIDYTERFQDRHDVLTWILLNQAGRRNVNNYDKGLMALKLQELLKIKGKENMSKGGEGLTILSNLNSRKEAASAFNVSEGTLNKVKQVEEKGTAEQKKELKTGTTTVNKVYNDIKQAEKRKEIEKLKTIKTPIITGLYDVIYIDPPWKYDFSQSSNREIENNYPTMSLEELKEINIPAAKNSVMLMWATAPKLIEAIELLKYWGFNYKTNMVWDKETIGMGYWCRGQHEILLIGTKGEAKPPEPENRFSSVFREKKTKHSKKPNEYYNMIEKMFPGKTLLEMFARQKINNNWNVWGNQAEGIVENELKNK